jgi:hypothetical protein
MKINNLIKKVLAGIANLLNEQRKTQNWGLVVFEGGEIREV